MKHVHAELIKAWADGAEIEVLQGTSWCPVESPVWSSDREYRIKPQPPIVFTERVWYNKTYGISVSPHDSEGTSCHVRFTVDSTTLEVIAVELVK